MLIRRFTVFPIAALLILLLEAGPARAADPVAAAKDLMKKHSDSVVSVTGTMKLTMSMQGVNMPAQENKFESAGTIIDASGLTVLSNSAVDFGDMLNALLGGAAGGDAAGQIKTKVEFAALKLRLADGTEIPAKIVLTDKELDMAFVMPDAESEEGKKAAGKYPALKLDGNAAPVEMLDEVIAIGRLPKSLGRQASAQLVRISAVVSKPRTFYAAASLAGSGTPVFTLDGKLLGIQLMRVDPDHGGGGGGGLFGPSPDIAGTPIIVPAADVAETAKQALTKK